ncbi:MAG: DUF819 family protein [Planctomycetes bacterium]|nr:DUF819 family protein [Planctomycetota bacterium]
MSEAALIHEPVAVLALLLSFLGLLFWSNQQSFGQKIFKFAPLLVFAYFVPTILSNTGVIPLESELYGFVKKWMLPASLLLLTLSVDVKGIIGLGRNAVFLFLGATFAIVVSGPIALWACSSLIPVDMYDQAWRGLSALAGSWIGGGANMIALKEHAGASDSMMSVIVVVDVAVANLWMAILLWFAGREKELDASINADRTSLDTLREKVATYAEQVKRPTDLGSLLLICALGVGGAVVATALAAHMPDVGEFIKSGSFTWIVILVSAFGLAASFTPLKKLEGAGASHVGSVFLYLLVTTIGAKAEFSEIAKPENIGFVVVGLVWMTLHAVVLLSMRYWLKAPIFFVAVGSKANIGGAASAPIVASAFHPALAPVGVLLAVGGYVLGTFAALICSYMLELVL